MKSWGIYILAVLGFIAYGAATKVDRDSTGAIVGEGSVDAFDIRVGDCFDDSSSLEDITSLPGVPCSDPHDNEAFALVNVELANYPGTDAMVELAFESCMERFETFVGKDYESSTLDIFTMYPTVESWKEDDREVVCSIYNMDASKLTGSVAGRAL